MPNRDKRLSKPKSTKYRLAATLDQLQAFYNGIRQGMSVESSSHLAGLQPKTVEKWLTVGRAIATQKYPPLPGTKDKALLDFLRVYEKSRSEFELGHVGNINNHATSKAAGQWTASAWMLERRRPTTYGINAGKEQYANQVLTQVLNLIAMSLPEKSLVDYWTAVTEVLNKETLIDAQKQGVIDKRFETYIRE